MDFKILHKDSDEFRQVKVQAIKQMNAEMMEQIKQISSESTRPIAIADSFCDLLKITSMEGSSEFDLIISDSGLYNQLESICQQDKSGPAVGYSSNTTALSPMKKRN